VSTQPPFHVFFLIFVCTFFPCVHPFPISHTHTYRSVYHNIVTNSLSVSIYISIYRRGTVEEWWGGVREKVRKGGRA
jgi:hypothetical protein